MEHGPWYSSPDWWVAIGTGLLFIATAGLWFFTALLWRATRKALADSGAAAQAAHRSAMAAEAGLDHARETARRQLRAYVIVTDVKLNKIDPDGRLTATARLENTGQTPALDVTQHQQIIGVASSTDLTHEFEYRGVPNPSSQAPLASGKHRLAKVSAEGASNILERVSRGEVIMIFRGWVRYKDVFGQDCETKYRFYLDAEMQRMGYDFAIAPAENSVS